MRLHLKIFRHCHPAAAFLLLLVFAATFSAQTSDSSQKVIKDAPEYNAYMTALNTKDAAARGAAMEAFGQQYPRSMVYTDSLEEAMAAWQQAGNPAKVKQVAQRLVAGDAGNVRALAVVVALDRASVNQGDKAALDELCPFSTAGMREVSGWKKPDGMADADFTALRNQMDNIFNGAAGFCALQQANYSQARDFLARAVALDTADLQNNYQLAVADLQTMPLDANGFWYCARAIHLAGTNTAATDSMTAYCKAKYRIYHGSEDGWGGVLSAAATQDALPAKFAKEIKPAPASTPKQK